MRKLLRVLIIEDSPDDTELLLRELRCGGYDPVYERVETASGMKILLEQQEWDVVLSDHSMPLFSGIGALTQLQLSGLDLPFIIVSGTIGEEIAVAAMRAGAHDYLMKDNLARLVPAIERELKEAEERRKRKEAEEALRKSEASLANAQRIAHLGNWQWNMRENKTYWSDEMYRIFGFAPQTIDGVCEAYLNSVHPDDRVLVKQSLDEALSRGKPYRIEHRIVLPGGSVRIVHDQAEVILDDTGMVVQVNGIVQDITERKHMEELCKLSNAIEQISNSIIVTDTEGKIEYVNANFMKLTGYTSEEIMGKNPSVLKSGKTPYENYKQLWNTITSGNKWQGEFINKKKNGELYWELTSISPVKNPDGVITNFIAIKEDITDRKKVERHLCLQYATTRVLVESIAIDEVIPKIIQAVCESLGWDIGIFWTIDQKTNVLRCIEIWHRPFVEVPGFKALSRQIVFSFGTGLPGKIWASSKPIWISDIARDASFLRAALAAKEDLHGAFGFPVFTRNEILGVLEFFSHEVQQPDEDLLTMMMSIGGQIGKFIEQKQADEALRRRIDFEKTVASISTRFVALSDFNNAISVSLADIGLLSEADRVYLFQFRDKGGIMDNTHEWCAKEINSKIQNLQNLPTSKFPWLMEKLHTGDVIHIPDVSKMSPEAVAEKEVLEKYAIKSLLALPVYAEKRLVGFIGFDNALTTGSRYEEDLALLRITAEIIGNAIARRQSESLINHMAYHDALTNLPNRILLQDRLEVAIMQAKRNEHMVAVMLLDLDRFKTINDTLGHHMGDLLLKAVAERLTRCMRESNTIVRMGGDEFIVVVPDLAHAKNAAIVAQKILDVLYQPFQIEGYEIHTTTSIGVSIYPVDADDVSMLIKKADTAMYHAKEQGRNTFEFYMESMNSNNFERMMLENSLRKALERGELSIYYQPQVDMDTEQIIGVEALVRWKHPDLGMIYPSKFIPIAEETGFIIPIGEWVLTTACTQAKAWHNAGFPTLRVSVNLSARQIKQQNLVGMVAGVLKETGLDPKYLELEITESIVMHNIESSLKVLCELKELGIRLSIDDFGMGYSSLSYLRRFSIDTIKIDQSFVRDITTNQDDAAIVTAIIAIAESLKLKVIAEGVENKEQLAFLHQICCNEIQGYIYSHPLSAVDMGKLLLKKYKSEE